MAFFRQIPPPLEKLMERQVHPSLSLCLLHQPPRQGLLHQRTVTQGTKVTLVTSNR
jgi:hypothetical protein